VSRPAKKWFCVKLGDARTLLTPAPTPDGATTRTRPDRTSAA
jgi:hypothetical protein